MWSNTDLQPRGTGKTTLIPVESLALDDKGRITTYVPQTIVFRDEEGIRPVCPFFEVHGEWIDATGTLVSGPVTARLLQSWGGSLQDMAWTVKLGNLKAFHYTYNEGDSVAAEVTVRGDDNRRTPILGTSPPTAREPLVPAGAYIPMGEIQVALTDDQNNELRVRFYAPKGLVYGPVDMKARISMINPAVEDNDEWAGFSLPDAQLVLNPKAAWPNFIQSRATLGPFNGGDLRNEPIGLLPVIFENLDDEIVDRSLGLIDDVSDGLVFCSLRIGDKEFSAYARIAVGPPDFAPANRHPASIADNLTDREDRAGPRDGKWTRDELGELAIDIFERAFETSDLMHKDYQNSRSLNTNLRERAGRGFSSPHDDADVTAMLWPVPTEAEVRDDPARALALSFAGTRVHRRQAAIEFLEDRFRENPTMFEKWIRRPLDPNPFYDRRMPALMRGSDGRPFHLTRRQWEILQSWIGTLREDTTAAGRAGPDT